MVDNGEEGKDPPIREKVISEGRPPDEIDPENISHTPIFGNSSFPSNNESNPSTTNSSVKKANELPEAAPRRRVYQPGSTGPWVVYIRSKPNGKSPNKVRETPAPKADKLEGLIEFGVRVQALCDHIEAANEMEHMSNPSLLQELVAKLPTERKMMWAAYRRCLSVVNLKTFSAYMTEVVQDALTVVNYEPETRVKEVIRDRTKPKGFVNSHTLESGDHTEIPEEPTVTNKAGPFKHFDCAHCEKPGHRLYECGEFKRLSVDDRWRRIRALRICQNCLYGHGRRSCRRSSQCDINGCQNRHHYLLHSPKTSNENDKDLVVAEHHTHRFLPSSSLFRIVPVKLYGKHETLDTFAFLDEGSDLTLIERNVATTLGIRGSPQALCLRWTGSMTRTEKNSERITMEISGNQNAKRYRFNARTVENLGLPSQHLQAEEMVQKYKHLSGIPLTSYRDAKPKILIGIDNLSLAVPLRTREKDGIAAVKTRLGWCVYGSASTEKDEAYNFNVCNCTCDRDLQESVKLMYEVDAVGVKPREIPLSPEEERALYLLKTTTKSVDNFFETGLLWRNDHIEFPDSYPMALSRLEGLERRMAQKPELGENVRRQIREYVEKGYAHRATKMELDQADPRRIWYLPLGLVTNPKKPSKVRMIWDAAAKVDGISLNSMLLKGPDQLASLVAILFRFRQFYVAVSSDIKEMFHQIRIRDDDKHSQRFLWRENPTEGPTVYLMDVCTFGSTCSPASAQFVKNLNATNHADLYPEASRAIQFDTYVDDYLSSFSSQEEAAKTAVEVRLVNKNGGFQLHHWRSNSTIVMEALNEKQVIEKKNLSSLDNTDTERVLGLLWDPSTDELSFSTDMKPEVRILIAQNIKPTKRQVLRCVMSLYDPLGVLAPYIIHGRILIQDLWRAKTTWDEQIPDEAFERWTQWFCVIEHIAKIRIPRCYFPNANRGTYDNVELHAFVDASEVAYCCVIYFRTLNPNLESQCSLITANAKVAPLKPWSIPRLELQACVWGARQTKFVQENHSVPISRTILWTDSMTALSWINADPRNYRPFVSNRIVEIQELTSECEWKWIPSKLNPADEATKWGTGPYFTQDSFWFSGPDFLKLPESDWPFLKGTPTTTTEEIRASVLHHTLDQPLVEYENFSSWEKLQRTYAFILRFAKNAKKNNPKQRGHLQQNELREAEEEIFRQIQKEAFADEIATLEKGLPIGASRKLVNKESKIYKMIPQLDDRGLLRQNSRIEAAKDFPYSVRYPIILPNNHRVTELLADRYHRIFRHGNSETVVNEMRQVYAIPGLRVLAKRVSKECQWCKIRRAKPSIPPMAPLPLARLAHHERAFTFTGLDYFGPLLVKVGRASIKRWIALFTCLTTRAVHLEVAHFLTTASCISCVKRFVGRRGTPYEFFTDNGTNFQGAERVLREQISQGLSATFTSSDTKWTFIPPGAPHMGGAWERLVQSVKRAMDYAFNEEKLDEEGLMTLVVEVESMVNTRPLTYLPIESEESEALTPNHFLLLSSNGAKTTWVDKKSRSDQKAKLGCAELRHLLGRSWDNIQNQLDKFWERWIKEYLPVIRRQSKWFEDSRQLDEGDVVMVIDPTKRNGWERGRILRLIHNPDGRARQAVVRTTSGEHKRPVSRLALLDVKGRTIPEDTETHQGETVAEQTATLATLA
ncbi:uncharacterized protein LOC129742655 [Uranotaenia lowii]|uniref:uncharacterized protein LOC129742655 n=1 Tax=Uranotaenia lowii TaxID=190385 RepID=UPI002479EB97|nr:uncharacterized protein LOC129742655 [Uranotaenia lowii]